MEAFKKTIKNRIAVMSVFNCTAVCLIVLANTGIIPIAHGERMDFIRGFLTGLIIAFELLFVVYIALYGRMLKNEEALRKQYIRETDERNQAIQEKIGGIGYQFLPILLLTTTVVSGFFNQTVFFTLLVCTFAVILFKAALKLYYRNKI